MPPERARPDWWLVAAFVALSACLVVPILRPRFLPLHDWPLHLAALSILRHHGDPTWGYARFYELQLLPVPYWGFFAPARLAAHFLPVELAGRITLAAGLVALPPAVALFAHRMGRSPWLALFAFPFAFHACFRFGFAAFTCALPLLFLALTALDAFLAAPSVRRGVLAAIAALALFFGHVLLWLFFLLAAPILLLSHGRRPRRIAAAAALLVPSLVAGLVAFRLAARALPAVSGRGFEGAFRGPLATLAALPRQLLYELPGVTWPLLGGLFVCWVVLLLLARRGPRPPGEGWPHRLLALTLLGVLVPFLSPVGLSRPVSLWLIGDRFIAVAALLVLLLPRVAFSGARRAWMMPVVLLAAFFPLRLATAFDAFSARMAGLERIVARRVPPGASTLTIVYSEGGDPALDPQAMPFKNAHAYPHLWRGGYDPWALSNGFPMKTRAGRALPAPPFRMPGGFSLDAHGRHYDFIVTWAERRDHLAIAAEDPSRAPLIAVDGEWRLYRPSGGPR